MELQSDAPSDDAGTICSSDTVNLTSTFVGVMDNINMSGTNKLIGDMPQLLMHVTMDNNKVIPECMVALAYEARNRPC